MPATSRFALNQVPRSRRLTQGLALGATLGCCFLGVCLLGKATLAADKPAKARVSMELVTEAGFPIDAAQKWYQLFADLGVQGLRIRGATGRDEVGIEKRGSDAAPNYQVLGLLTAHNVLNLPGGKFGLGDSAKLKTWLENLADAGIEGVTQSRSAFGMTGSQLQAVNDDLSRKVKFETKDLAAQKVVDHIALDLDHKLELDAPARRALEGVTVSENLLGLSSGTALAVVLRPAGLVMTPSRPKGGKPRYDVTKPVAGKESWPIGWKPDKPDLKVVPKLFEFINVEIDETPVNEAVEAIAGRLDVPCLWDQNALALHGIEPGKVLAKLPAKKLTYSLILQKILSQAKLKRELRIDENGKPFLWITTIKPA